MTVTEADRTAADVAWDLKPLVDVVNTLKVAAQGNAITLTGQVSKEILDRLMQKGQ